MSRRRSGPDVLAFVDAVRTGGAHRAERRYTDFVVNGRRLSSLIGVGDKIGVFGWQSRAVEQRCARQLLLRSPSELPSGCVPLYVCPECGDLGCGVVSVRVAREGDCIVWSEIGFDSPHGATVFEPRVDSMRDLWFDGCEYENALTYYL